MEGMKLSDLYNTYGKIKKDQVSPRQLLKIVIYAGMNRIYSSRDIERSCRRDINFMYLLEGKPFPNHATIARFISLHLSQCCLLYTSANKASLAEYVAHRKVILELLKKGIQSDDFGKYSKEAYICLLYTSQMYQKLTEEK